MAGPHSGLGEGILDVIDRKWEQWLVRTPDGHVRRGKEIEQIEREVMPT